MRTLHANPSGEEHAVSAKPFDMPKRLVWNAWRLVRANRGSAGVDEISLDLFERDLKDNLYQLCNRMSGQPTSVDVSARGVADTLRDGHGGACC